MGKGGGGGGGTGAGKIQIPQALGSGPGSLYYNVFNPIGTFGSETLGSLGSLYNWATDLATGGNVSCQGASFPQNGLLADTGSQTYAPFTGQNGLSAQGNSLLGPILGGEYSALAGMGQTAANLSQATNGGTSILDEGNKLVKMATTGTGLFPSQQAMINQSVASQQAATQQQLGNMGLGSSTVAKQLAGQISLSGAAAAGQLVQGNLQLGEAEQQLGTQVNEALYNEYAGIASQSQSMQNQLYSQAMQGIGALGTMMNETLAAFGYSMRTQEDVLGANENEAAIQAQVNEQAAQASAQGFSSLMGGLGSLFGQSGSGSGGLLGGAGGLLGSFGSGIGGAGAGAFGTVGDLAAGGAASAGASGSLGALGSGLLGSLGSLGSGIGAAIGVLFSSSCTAGRGLKGVNDIRWVLFRDWILYRSPRLIRTFYVRHCDLINRTIAEKAWVRKTVLFLIDQVVTHDQNTRAV